MMLSSLRRKKDDYFNQWLIHRIPRASSHTLNHRRIFIFISRQGFAFLIVLALMLVAAINYENNLAFALTFWLIGLFIVSIFYTYANLSKLTIDAISASDAFVGEPARFGFLIKRQNSRERYALRIGWSVDTMMEISLRDADEQQVDLYVFAERRGWLLPKRVLLESYYPLGLFRAWTWLEFDRVAVVFPKPIQGIRQTTASDRYENDVGKPVVSGQNDFDGLRDYQQGDSLNRIYWPSIAREQSIQSKCWVDTINKPQVYDWNDYPALNTEERLSALCFDILAASNQHETYGLNLPTICLTPTSEPQQRDRALRALALYGLPQNPFEKRGGA